MPFVSRPGLNGKIYIPEQLPGQKKHYCKSCFSCQVCSDDRCSLCLGQMCKKAEVHKAIINRNQYKVAPGLYCVGEPDHDSPVLVSANYKLSFDALRRALSSTHAWILVLDTRGVNVWCAAGKGTFSTAEIVRQVKASNVENVVSHRRLILPQLSATGVAAHQVKKQCGFTVQWGPVRAEDVETYITRGNKRNAAMRKGLFFSSGIRSVRWKRVL